MDKEASKQELQRLDEEVISVNPSLKNINPKKRQELLQAYMGVVSVTKMHSGPLPDVETLKGYDEIIPNGGERLMQQVEKQGNHRRKIESKVVNWNNFQSLLGQVFGLLIAGGVLFASYDLAMKGHESVAKVLGSTTIIGLAGIFVYGKKKQREDF
ncbi:DUF2335 domain-containing protein [Capnocytophaga felis]|uniref:Membrane protein n=1 Tax=Capnocytophaga felis TaxID=2267611 RepID=A0A5M4B7J9_9FLAO|nr:DUF2335 domain-containing protein [Capnocytophaga felis]GET45255.1 membrane protein [Capnocytophaga felis]GET47582.1 membrane protein [Capnocytophaga felis]